MNENPKVTPALTIGAQIAERLCVEIAEKFKYSFPCICHHASNKFYSWSDEDDLRKFALIIKAIETLNPDEQLTQNEIRYWIKRK